MEARILFLLSGLCLVSNSYGLSFEGVSAPGISWSTARAGVFEDINGDGFRDSVTISSSNFLYYTNDQDRTYTSAQTVGASGSIYGIGSGDVDGDGDIDILTAGPNGSTTSANSVFLNNAGTFGTGTTMFTAHGEAFYGQQATTAQLNSSSDSDLDAVWFYTSGIFIGWGPYDGGLNQFTGSVNAANYLRIAGTGSGSTQAGFAVDLDSDGDMDLIVAKGGNSPPGSIEYLINDGAGNFTATVIDANSASWDAYTTESLNPIGMAVADFNGDGDPDLLFHNTAASTNSKLTLGIRISADGATPAYSFSSVAVAGVSFGTYSYSNVWPVKDLDADGNMDVILGGNDGAKVLLGGGDGSFTLFTSLSGRNSQIVDMDKDGRDDILTNSASVRIYYNSSPGIKVSTISGNTTENGDTATFTIELLSQPTADVTIGLSSSNLAEATVAPASVTFTSADWDTPQIITVTGVDDDIQDGGVVYSIVTGVASSADGDYSGLDAADIVVTNADNDTAGITVSTISGNVTEAGGTATFSVLLNTEPTADVIIGLTSSDTTEGTVSPVSLTFTNSNWGTNQTVTVTGVDDNDVDGDISFSIVTAAAVSADGLYSGINPDDVNVSNLDDDVSGSDSNNDGISDTQAASIGLDPNDPDSDSDGDGLSDAAEIGDPQNPADTDGDGIIDALEPGDNSNDGSFLATFITPPTAEALNLTGLSEAVVTIESAGAGVLIAHPNDNRGVPLYSKSDMLVDDNGYEYPLGLLEFSVTSPAGTAEIVIAYPSSVTLPDDPLVRKLTSDNQWQEIEASIDFEANTITILLQDNDIYDLDPEIGIIRGPIGIASRTATPTDDNEDGDDDNLWGTGMFDSRLLLVLISTGYLLRRKRAYIRQSFPGM